MIAHDSITDHQRLVFLQALMKSDLLFTEWETNFLASFRSSSRPSLWFTEGRRTSTDKMWMKFGGDVGVPWPALVERRASSVEGKIPDADPDACEYLVRVDGRQRPCNEPATKQRRNGFRYCDTHAEAAQADVKRTGKVMELFPFCHRDAETQRKEKP